MYLILTHYVFAPAIEGSIPAPSRVYIMYIHIYIILFMSIYKKI